MHTHTDSFKKIYNSYHSILEKGIYLVIIRLMTASSSRFAFPVVIPGLNPTGTTFDLASAKGQ